VGLKWGKGKEVPREGVKKARQHLRRGQGRMERGGTERLPQRPLATEGVLGGKARKGDWPRVSGQVCRVRLSRLGGGSDLLPSGGKRGDGKKMFPGQETGVNGLQTAESQRPCRTEKKKSSRLHRRTAAVGNHDRDKESCIGLTWVSVGDIKAFVGKRNRFQLTEGVKILGDRGDEGKIPSSPKVYPRV